MSDQQTDPKTPPQPENGGEYTADDLQELKGLEAVRKRPGMYIKNLDVDGLNQLLFEAVDNSVDEAMAGYCTEITVTLEADGLVVVEDNGRGIPVDIHHETGISGVELVMTRLHAGGKFDTSTYKVSGGLHGVGISVTNALSEWLQVDVYRDGAHHAQRFHRGDPEAPLAARGPSDRRGTRITFLPEYERFSDVDTGERCVYHTDMIAARLRELAFLNAGLTLRLCDRRREDQVREEEFHYDGGIRAFIVQLHENKSAVHPEIFYYQKSVAQEGAPEITVEVALQYNQGYDTKEFSFANNINTYEGGRHLEGFRTALTRSLNTYAKDRGLIKDKNLTLSGEDFREGLTAVVSVKVPQPTFQNQHKSKLLNNELRGIVESLTNEQLAIFLEEHPVAGRNIINKAMLAARARVAARKAREATRKEALNAGHLPGKLADCSSRDVQTTELFLVEGESAGGTAKMGRNREFQAILPLRGKILNVEKAARDKMLGHEEILTLIQALGCGVPGVEDFDLGKLRYGKVVIMTDADVDGSHIRTLLLTFFYRQMPELIRRGYVYVAQPPLYKIKRRKQERYVLSDAEMDHELLTLGRAQATLAVRATGQTFEGQRLADFLDVLVRLEQHERALRKKGLRLARYLQYRHPDTGALPVRYLRHGDRAQFFYTDKDANAWLAERAQATGLDLVLITEQDAAGAKDDRSVFETRVPQSREIANAIEKLRHRQLSAEDYAPPEGDDTTRFELQADDAVRLLRDLPAVLAAVRARGGEGLEIQRYKGLGEMNADQLWETTMDPEKRAMLKVRLEDDFETDRIFTLLMGDLVEPRRCFIEKHALEVKNLDV